MDRDTQEVVGEAKWLTELVAHEGWKIARMKLLEKIADLKNAFEVDDSSPEKMLVDLQSRKAAVTLLMEFLRDIEGSKDVVNTNQTLTKESYIVKLD